jgi:hypothetical protein
MNNSYTKQIDAKLIELGRYSGYFDYIDKDTLYAIGQWYKNNGWVVYISYSGLGMTNIIGVNPEIIENHEHIKKYML